MNEHQRFTYFLCFIAGIFVIVSALVFFDAGLSGFLTGEQETASQTISLDSSGTYDVVLDSLPENAEVTGIMVSGQMEGEGSAKVYLETEQGRYLVLDSDDLRASITAITGAQVAEEPEEEEEEDELEEEEEEPEQEEAEEEPEVNETEEPEEEEEEPEEEPEEDEPEALVYAFSNTCEDTCILPNLNVNTIVLNIEIDSDTVLYLDGLSYSYILVEDSEEPAPVETTPSGGSSSSGGGSSPLKTAEKAVILEIEQEETEIVEEIGVRESPTLAEPTTITTLAIAEVAVDLMTGAMYIAAILLSGMVVGFIVGRNSNKFLKDFFKKRKKRKR